MAEGVVRRLPVARGELPGEGLAAHSVDGACVVVVRDGGVARLHRPHGLAQAAHGRGRVEHDLRPVQPVHHPGKLVEFDGSDYGKT